MTEGLTILRAATHETELGDHDFCLSRSHYTDTDPTSRERAATAGIEPGTSSPGVARSTQLPRPAIETEQENRHRHKDRERKNRHRHIDRERKNRHRHIDRERKNRHRHIVRERKN